jgi:hypothetical protein
MEYVCHVGKTVQLSIKLHINYTANGGSRLKQYIK